MIGSNEPVELETSGLTGLPTGPIMKILIFTNDIL